MMIKKESIDLIIENVDLISFLSQELDIKRVGKSYKALCPFHEEKTPSFSINPQENLFYCFGCQKGGNIVNYLKEKGYSFPDAMRLLSNYTGIPLEEENKINVNEKEQRLKRIIKIAHEWYHEQLDKNPSIPLIQVKHLKPLIQSFLIGYAPSNIAVLLNRLKDYPEKEIEECGIYSFRNRLMFPIHNKYGDIIGFSGRRIDNNSKYAKYLNSPTSSIFQKDKILHGFYHSYQLIKQRKDNEKVIILTEGTIDVIRLLFYGIPVVGTLSTHLSSYQKTLLESHFDKVILCYDADKAGIKAVLNLIQQQWDIPVYVVSLKEEKDIDDYIIKNGVEAFTSLITEKIDRVNWFIDYLLSNPHNKPEEFNKLLGSIKTFYEQYLSNNEQLYYFNLFVNRLSNTFKIPKSKIEELLEDKPKKHHLPIIIPKQKTQKVVEKKSDKHKEIKEKLLECLQYRETLSTTVEELYMFVPHLESEINNLSFKEGNSPLPLNEIKLKIYELGKTYLKEKREKMIEVQDNETLSDVNEMLLEIERRIQSIMYDIF